VNARLQSAEGQKQGLPASVAIVQKGSSFRFHLLQALRRGDERKGPSTAPSRLFLAFPEKLLSKWYYLAFGEQRSKTAGHEGTISNEWRLWDGLGENAKLLNFPQADPKAVFVAHGLSAIDDSILLLADLGRTFRAARCLRVPLRILLAGIEWISYNRSLKRFGLPDDMIENGLRLCQDRRQHLYEALGAEVAIHEIVGYSRKGAINRDKIKLIANRYLELAEILWGKDKINTPVPLTKADMALIGKQLPQSIGDDSALKILGRFPGALQRLEESLTLHLGILRTIAQHFRILSLETFSYYFAQYYAQDTFRGTHVKIAPISEKQFDEPFDKLDASFRSWGEGHDPEVGDARKSSGKRLAAVYLPQYNIGSWEVLPYTPLSLSAVEEVGIAKNDVEGNGHSIEKVRHRLIFISDGVDRHGKIQRLLQETLDRCGAPQLNRLIYDVLSFVQTAIMRSGRAAFDSVFNKLGMKLENILIVLDESLPKFCEVECEAEADIADLWLSWLDTVDREPRLDYFPSHILLATFTREDWTPSRLAAASSLCAIANVFAASLSR